MRISTRSPLFLLPAAAAAGYFLFILLSSGAVAQQIPAGPGRKVVAPLPVGVSLGRFVRFLRPGASGLARGASWQVWWELNKDWYLGIARRHELRKRDETGKSGPFLGRKTGPEPGARPFGADLFVRLIRPDLELALKDPKTVVRISAAFALGLLGDARSTGVLVDALGDPGSEVQDAAVLALGMVNDARALEILKHLVAGSSAAARLLGRDQVNDQRRATAAIALGLTAREGALETLLNAALRRREARGVQAAAVVGLGLLGLADCEAPLVKILKQSGTRIQLKALAATSLGRLSGEQAGTSLLEAMRSKRTDVRRAAALALGGFEPRAPMQARYRAAVQNRRMAGEAAPDVIARLDGFVEEFREPAEEEQERLERYHAARRRALSAAAAGDSEYAVRQFATIALGQVGWTEDRSLLFRILADESLEIRPFAALALGLLGGRGGDRDGAAARVLTAEFVREVRLDHKIALAVGLGLRGWREAGSILLKEFKATSEPLSRSYYAISLALLGYTEGLTEVVGTLGKGRDRDEIQQCAMAYGLLAGEKSTDGLTRILKTSKDRYEVMGASVGLALFGRSEDLRLLSLFLRNRNIPAATRAFVIEGIGMAGDVRDPSLLARLAGAHNFHLSFAAIDRAIQRKW